METHVQLVAGLPAALRGVSAALTETSLDLTEAGLEEMAEGATRLAVSRGMEVGSEVLAVAGALEIAEAAADQIPDKST